MMKEWKYKFSVIIPVYNVESFLADTIDSVIEQSIGFEENIQIIIVNDGSPDNSEEICLEYADKYPKNIIYLKQENAGVSAARNAGIPYAEGKYINFLDSDDKWASTAFEKVYDFFESHYDEVDVVSCRMKFFEAMSSFHAVDYKYRRPTRVANLMEEDEYDSIQLHVTSSFLKSDAIGDTRFAYGIKFGEDSLFINEVILKKATLGLVSNARHFYRKRRDQSSAVQNQRKNKEYYNVSPRKYYYSLIEMSKERYGYVIPYVQNILAYDIGWRLDREIPEGVLNEQEYNEYCEMLHDLLSYVDDRFILENKVHVSIIRKLTAITIKKKSDSFFKEMIYNHDEQALYYQKIKMVSLNLNNNACFVNIAKIENDCLHVEGIISKWILDSTQCKTKFLIITDNKIIEPQLFDYNFKKENTFFGVSRTCYRFLADIPLKEYFSNGKRDTIIKLAVKFDDKICDLGLNYGKFVANYNTFLFSSTVFKPYFLKCYRTGLRVVKPVCMPLSRAVNEAKCLAWLVIKKHRRAFLTRILYFLLGFLIKGGKRIWLISDRSDKADDNGEAFFEYAVKQNSKKIKPVFVINKDSKDVERLKKIGKVIYFDSFIYPYYFLSADKIISSSGGEYVINPFGWVNCRYLIDLMKFDYVFLQHGITMNDLSSWLHKFNKNISLFVTASTKEYESISDTDYLYSKDVVKLTGFARYDKIENKAEKLVVVIPTWRRSIKESYDSETKSVYFDGFKETEYFKFYNQLINDESLLKKMREKGYKGLFCLHPIHQKQFVDFESNDVFSVNEGFVDYKEMFSKGSVLVTDYSSVAFDFAYLRKPVVYSQFDKDEFFEGQIFNEGYFSFNEDGMGPVCVSLEETVSEIVALLDNDCVVSEKYTERVDSFFAYNDRNNCERIYNEIIFLDKNKAMN